MYIYDGQVTYNYDLYYNNFMDKGTVTFGSGFFKVTMSAPSAFDQVNSSSQSMTGMILTKDPTVVDALRNVSNSSIMNSIPLISLPDVYFGYNHLNKNRLLSSGELVSRLIPFELNINETDYMLHNPQSMSIFCAKYSAYKLCNGIDNLQYILPLDSVFSFFSN
jgi:hypothetical protein